MNKVILMGRLTRDPDIRTATGENTMTIARYTLAVDRRTRKTDTNEPTADFISCVAFGKAAEFAEKYFHQGMRVLITGRIQTGSYTNKDGQKVYTTDVIIDEQEFADSRAAGQVNSTGIEASQADSMPGDGFMNLPVGVEDDGIPFG
jgi:single-strand DNA-binding protein